MTLIAYHNDPELKNAIIAQLEAHRAADQIIKGRYWESGKGCAVGCTIYSSNHAEYETQFGIPIMLAKLEDTLFEGMSNADAVQWPVRFMSCIVPGADLSLVGQQFLQWLIVDTFERFAADAAAYAARAADDVADAVAYAAVAYAARAGADADDVAVAVADAAVAYAARAGAVAARAADAGADADAVAYAAVAYAARAGAVADAVAYASVAYAARAGAVAYAARATDAGAYKRQSDKLCELIAAAPMVNAR